MPPGAIKTTFSPLRAIQPFYTGGPVSIALDGCLLGSSIDDTAVLTSLSSGRVVCEIEGDSEPLTAIVLTPNASHVVTLSRSLSMRIYKLSNVEEAVMVNESGNGNDAMIEAELVRTVKAHASPVVVAAVERQGTLIATGGADGIVKVWDVRGGFVTHTFHGHSGLVSALHFFEAPATTQPEVSGSNNKKGKSRNNDQAGGLRLASGGEDGKIRIWNLTTSSSVAVLDSHVSVVRGLDYCEDEGVLLSGSRDKTVISWDSRSWKIRNTIPVLESIEACGFVPGQAPAGSDRLFYTAGENGRLRLWSFARRGEVTRDQPASENETDAIVAVLSSPSTDELIAVRADQVLMFCSIGSVRSAGPVAGRIEPLTVTRQVSGTHDEVIDMAVVGPNGTHLALATNTEDIRIISLSESSSEESSGRRTGYFGADTAHLSGHSDIVLALDVDPSGCWLATGSKDATARLWHLDPEAGSFRCHSVYTGHAGALGGIALPHAAAAAASGSGSSPPKWLVTGSQDRTVKLWTVPTSTSTTTTTDEPLAGKAKYTRKAHDKDINALDASADPHRPLFASASQDKTVRIWDVETGETVGVLRGHSRGVWTVRFGPVDGTVTVAGSSGSTKAGFVLTGAGDKTVRVWSLGDFSCVATLEGHANSVLKVVWLSAPAVEVRGLEGDDGDDDDGDFDMDRGSAVGGRQGAVPGQRRTLAVSASADGLVKVWDLATAECACTLDGHTDRVWALAVPGSRQAAAAAAGTATTTTAAATASVISGGADAVINFWADTTSATVRADLVRQNRQIEDEQRLANLRRSGRIRDAVGLAIALERPNTLLALFRELVEADTVAVDEVKDTDGDEDSAMVDTAAGPTFGVRPAKSTTEIGDVVAGLSDVQLFTLVVWLRDWNASAKTADVAQRVLYAILGTVGPDRLVKLDRCVRRGNGLFGANRAGGDESETTGDGDGETTGEGDAKESTVSAGLEAKLRKIRLGDVVAGLAAYTDRHRRRNDDLVDESYLLDFLLGEMGEVAATPWALPSC